MSTEYKANEYARQAQRFVYPLYKKDERDGFCFSSTATFVTYKDQFFCIFAAHALEVSETSLEHICMLRTDGIFMSLADICEDYKIFRQHDVVICVTDEPFELRNYFVLQPKKSTTEFKLDGFGWIGFPQKKVLKSIHKSKSSPVQIAQLVSELNDGSYVWSLAKFLLLGIALESKNESQIMGKHENIKVDYEHEGFKEKGYSLRGMSGGAFFHGPKKINTKYPELNDMFLFAGVGLEYDGKLVKGISKELIISLIDAFLKQRDSEDGDDYQRALVISARIRSGEEKVYSMAEVEASLGLTSER